jgi:hypothetical protein
MELHLTVRYTSVKEDLATFTQTLFRRTGSNLVDILPNLQTLRIEPTVAKIDLSDKKLKKAIYKQHPVDVQQNLDWSLSFLDGGRITDDVLWMCPPPSVRCDLGGLGTVPAGLLLVCHSLRPSANLSNIERLDLKQLADNSDAMPLKTTRLRELKTGPFFQELEGSWAGNFINAMLHHLPPTFKRLTVRCSPGFNMPSQFPAEVQLEKLAIQGVNFVQPSLKGLRIGLQELALDLDSGGTEDGEAYAFLTLDVTDLPPTLTVLKIRGRSCWVMRSRCG